MGGKKLKVALVGCGRISANHFEAIDKNPNLELVAVCDALQERVEEAAQKWDVASYTSYEEMLDKSEINIVTLCTPSGLHSKQAVMAASRKIHVITEKPMAITLKDADMMIEASIKNDVKLFVVKQNRLNTTLQLVKRAVKKNRFGKIYMATVNVFWQRPQSYYDAASWRGTWELDGGAFMNQASHYVDMLEWLIGDVEKVYAITDTMGRDIEAEDTGSAVLRFQNGVIGNMNVTMLTYPKNLAGNLTILGEKGTVIVGGTSVNTIEKWEFDEPDEDDILVHDASYTPPSVYGFGHQGYYENVTDVLMNGAMAGTDGNEGRKSLEVILAIYQSARENREIKLPLF
ncbi:Gfo/Idh/MocA family protein [Paenibacillus sp. GCM10023248]|uniref:Gfo/Idh/MocA family protein n=1 Tax=unclassified Paenibacillus TaxID=185978 RepID=UPI0023789609|nr:Gfo/Idh/MocA family oxidoreductase [Paenibacillus sp. MAHUQ-63]MDD9271810.1 Gfo/Idh/MocA family oxidoreductase [Paenibacillus sp. MAHUQ-63]